MLPHPLLLASLLALLVMLPTACARVDTPLALHRDNPHYFQFRGKPTILLTSAEHYGAVLNSDFDYVKYLDTLAADRLNHTRMFVGAYCEHAGALNIAGNTLSPAPGRFVCPWARSDQPGYANGGDRFDLTRWDQTYFDRLKGFISHASRRGIVVEVNLFCPFYFDEMWALSPMNARNNVNNVGDVARDAVYTLDRHGGLLTFQEAMVRKVVAELKDFDNLYYEVMNEPYVGKVPLSWQNRMIDVIVAAQREVGDRHLISVNVANGTEKVHNPHSAVSIFNFHYAWPPDAVAMNYALDRVIGENETGIVGGSDFYFRREGWAFILAGGGLYNNLDYSFTVGHEDGTYQYPPTQPGGGSAALRKQLRILSDFMHGFDFIRMKPAPQTIRSELPAGVAAFVLSEPGKQYAVYLCRTEKAEPSRGAAVELSLDLPRGRYRIEWLSPARGTVDAEDAIDHAGGERRFSTPAFAGDVALRVVRSGL
jgi:hypothetical protein